MGEVCRRLFGGQVKVGENDDAGDRVLDDLCTPAGVLARVESLAQAQSRAG